MLCRFIPADTAPTALARTFHASPVILASGYFVFLKQTYEVPKLKAELASLRRAKRGKFLATWYHALSPDEKAKFQASANANAAKKEIDGTTNAKHGQRGEKGATNFVKDAT